MKENEIYELWSPIPELTGDIIVDKLEDTDEGLIIFFSFPKSSILRDRRIRIVFESYIAYRNMDESYRSNTFCKMGAFKDSFYTVTESNWLKWFHIESLNMYQDRNINHYAILTIADCIDILTEFPPEIDWVD